MDSDPRKRGGGRSTTAQFPHFGVAGLDRGDRGGGGVAVTGGVTCMCTYV